MKKLLSLWLALLVLLAPLTGCAGQVPDAVPSSGGANEPAAVAVPDAEDAPSTENATHDALPTDNGGEALGPAITGSETILLGGVTLDEEGWYSSKEEVALYLMEYGVLPGNFITKKDAKALGWEGGALDPYAPGMSIGGDHFGNYEGSLPQKEGRTYTECDIDTQGAKKRGAKRIIFSDDGLIFYTEDHYETFTLLAGEE